MKLNLRKKAAREFAYKLSVFAVAVGLPLVLAAVGLFGEWGKRAVEVIKSGVRKSEILIGLVPPKPTPVPLPWLSTRGNQIVDASGKAIVLRGANISSLYWGYEKWHPEAVGNLATEWGAKVVRIRVHEDRFLADPKAWFKKIENEIAGPAREAGIYVVIHPWIGNNQPLPDDKTVEMWRMIAQRYKDDPTILYDLLAEPREVSWRQTREAYKNLIETVREVNPKSLIFVSGLSWGRRINEYLDEPLPYGNIVYRSNPYNHIGQFEDLFGKIATKYPVFLGEFGPSPDMDIEDVKALVAYAQKLRIGWTAWAFQSIGCPCLLSDYQIFKRSEYGEVVYRALREN